MEKINFKSKGETGAIPINAENLNLMQDNIENGINDSKIQLNSSETQSDEEGYACNYINNLAENLTNGCYFKSFSGKSSINIYSKYYWDVCFLICSTGISIVNTKGTGTPTVIDIYGTRGFTAMFDGEKAVISNLETWEHYIIICSDGVTKIE